MHIAETPFSRLALGDGWRTIVDRVGGLIATLGIVIEDAKAGLLGAFPQSMNALLIPVRVFDDEAAARSWLLQFVDPDSSPG